MEPPSKDAVRAQQRGHETPREDPAAGRKGHHKSEDEGGGSEEEHEPVGRLRYVEGTARSR